MGEGQGRERTVAEEREVRAAEEDDARVEMRRGWVGERGSWGGEGGRARGRGEKEEAEC